MSTIQFEEQNPMKTNNRFNQEKSTFNLSSWLVQKGIVQTPEQAKIVLVVITILCFALSIYFIIPSSSDLPEDNRTPEQIQSDPYFKQLPPSMQQQLLDNYTKN